MGDDRPINGSMHPVNYEKPHDVSFDKDNTLMRTRITKGWGEEARDGSTVTLRFTVSAPGDNGEELVYDSDKTMPSGVKFTVGQNFHAEVLDRGVLTLTPGTVANVICIDAQQGYDEVLNLRMPNLPESATKTIKERRHEELMAHEPHMMQDKEVEFWQEAAKWKPPESMTRWHLRIDSVTPGVIPVYMTWPEERLGWSNQQKNFGNELLKHGQPARAARRFKKAMLDLEIPTEWGTEERVIKRNHLRLALHLNIALSGIKSDRWDDAIWHATKALETDKNNVKALFRRGMAHLRKPQHANGLAAALEDLRKAQQLDPSNAEVKRLLAEAKEKQKEYDRSQMNMFSKALEAATY
eukprot:CAMPEP_0119318280 /NCGR_PEP_ID=MMETSP1333-20130426/45950_1 /TAXON_ID=418940 /ORGANISM="Scyphosphaera apsteinii, Strain RCC1455" /LENGTH=353 /DNA_ID=CAMNT_0007324425 /DNA_START=25 /DNA_END=1086 /DNA_ORIENTATION=-